MNYQEEKRGDALRSEKLAAFLRCLYISLQ